MLFSHCTGEVNCTQQQDCSLGDSEQVGILRCAA